MKEQLLLIDIFYYFAATVICVPLFKAIRLGSVMGYLIAGILLGPYGLKLLHNPENISEISQFGIIMLLFVIGLELTPKRLKILKSVIWRAGPVQFFTTVTIFMLIQTIFSIDPVASFIMASALTLSSTAFALSFLKESVQLRTNLGQASLGILIFQDIIIIPLLTTIPFLTGKQNLIADLDLIALGINLITILTTVVLGKIVLGPLFSWIYRHQSKEIFISTCFLVITGSALLMEYAGLSKALGAFLAGIFLSNSDLRGEIQSFSVPIKSMMLGVFFMGFGLELDLVFLFDNFFHVLMITTSFMAIKYFVVLLIGRVQHKSWKKASKMGLILCQAGEFGFLLISVGLSYNILPAQEAKLLLSTITFSVFLAPFLTKFCQFGLTEVPPKIMITQTRDNKPSGRSNNVNTISKAS